MNAGRGSHRHATRGQPVRAMGADPVTVTIRRYRRLRAEAGHSATVRPSYGRATLGARGTVTIRLYRRHTRQAELRAYDLGGHGSPSPNGSSAADAGTRPPSGRATRARPAGTGHRHPTALSAAGAGDSATAWPSYGRTTRAALVTVTLRRYRRPRAEAGHSATVRNRAYQVAIEGSGPEDRRNSDDPSVSPPRLRAAWGSLDPRPRRLGRG
jgi:hypothetical protein